jgi:hypothetical protein
MVWKLLWIYSGVPAVLGICNWVPIFNLQLPCSALPELVTLPPLLAIFPSPAAPTPPSAAPRALLRRAHRLPGPHAGLSLLLHVAPAMPEPPRARRPCQLLLHARRASPSLKACPGVPLDFFYPFHRTALLLLPSSARLPSPEPRRSPWSQSSAASTTSHLRSNAPAAPPRPTEAH